MPDRGNRNTIQATHTSVRVLRALLNMDGARVTELADALDMAPSTVHAHLATLEAEELVATEGDVYHLALEFVNFGDHARTRKEAYRLAESYVRQLADETGYRAVFAVEQHGRGFYLYVHASEHTDWSHAQVGSRVPLHSVAFGKAILAFLPERRVDDIVDRHGLPARTANTVTDRDALAEELARVRERGVAFNREENVEGIRAVGAPVRSGAGSVVGALSVSGPANRLTGATFETDVPDTLLGLVNEFELELEFS